MAGLHARPSRAHTRAGAYARDRQPVTDGVKAVRRARLRRRTKGASIGASALAGALVVGVLGGGSTFALWNDTTTLSPGTIHTGTAVLSLSSAHVDATNMLPGEIRGTVVELSNNGDADLAVTAVLAQVSDRFEVRTSVDHANCGIDPIGGTALDDSDTASLGTIATGDSVDLCVEVTALTDLVPDDEFHFDVTLEGATSS